LALVEKLFQFSISANVFMNKAFESMLSYSYISRFLCTAVQGDSCHPQGLVERKWTGCVGVHAVFRAGTSVRVVQ